MELHPRPQYGKEVTVALLYRNLKRATPYPQPVPPAPQAQQELGASQMRFDDH